jgi:hypothetical protein
MSAVLPIAWSYTKSHRDEIEAEIHANEVA